MHHQTVPSTTMRPCSLAAWLSPNTGLTRSNTSEHEHQVVVLEAIPRVEPTPGQIAVVIVEAVPWVDQAASRFVGKQQGEGPNRRVKRCWCWRWCDGWSVHAARQLEMAVCALVRSTHAQCMHAVQHCLLQPACVPGICIPCVDINQLMSYDSLISESSHCQDPDCVQQPCPKAMSPKARPQKRRAPPTCAAS